MSDNAKNATIAKIRAMYGKRLQHENYKELISKKNVNEVAEYLQKSTHYSEVLENIDASTIHRGFLESLLKKHSFDSYTKICKFQQLDKYPFYDYQIKHLEIQEILTAILHYNAQTEDEHISTLPAFLIDKASFDLIELAKVQTIDDLYRVLRHTPYDDLLRKCPLDDNNKFVYTQCETIFRTYHIKWLLSTASKEFKGDAKKSLIDQIQMQIDLINIINSYRLKAYFKADADTIKQNILPFYGRLSIKKQQELFEAANIEEFESIFNKTIYGRQIESFENDFFEQNLTELRCIVANRQLRSSRNAAVSVYTYLYLFDMEISNIIKIIEGIRYNKSPSDIEKLLIII